MSTQYVQLTTLPEPTKTLVSSIPVKEGEKLMNNISWEDLRGLSWEFQKDWS